MKDFCTYWFRRAQEHLLSGQRAGFVGTNSISQTGGRVASLDYVVDNGGVITDAVSSQEWPGDAKVHVSIVNWIKGPVSPIARFTLDSRPVEAISTQLRAVAGDTSGEPTLLGANAGRCFAGVVPQAMGFFLTQDEAHDLGHDPAECSVVRRFLTGEDITSAPDQGPSRWVLDFRSLPLEEAMRFPKALALVRDRVRPEREASRNRAVEKRWWLFGRRVKATRAAIDARQRFVAAASTGKRLALAWQDRLTVPNNAVTVFAFDDDYSMGILLSRAHGAWAWARSSTLKGDLRYTSAAVFMTFPWPDPVTDEQRERVAEASRRLLARRTEICTAENIGLTKLYNAVDDGAWTDLTALHQELDEAVAECYGWPRAAAQDDAELVRLLTERNRDIVEGDRAYDPFKPVGDGT